MKIKVEAEKIFPFVLLFIFLGAAASMYLKTGKSFFLFDLPFIGFSIFMGLLLNLSGNKTLRSYGRRVSQLLVGFYFLFFLGLKIQVNMQIEGFFFLIFMGVFSGAVLHYSIAKVFGPLVFGRGFCGWACWTAMVLDFLPWKKSPGRKPYYGIIRYIHFALSLGLVLILFYLIQYRPMLVSVDSVYWFLIGNAFYMTAGITLAAVVKDNRAFCKYICPIPVIQKLTARFALFKVELDAAKCIRCGACEKICPMDIPLLAYMKDNKRITSTECIMCAECIKVCPKRAVKLSAKITGLLWR